MKFRTLVNAALGGLLLLLPATLAAQGSPLPFRKAIELALRNSAATAIGGAEAQRARAAYLQGRDLFLPQVTFGSGLAETYGFPLSVGGSGPSLFNVNTQQFLLNPAQLQFNKAARSDIKAMDIQNADRRNDVIMEAALDYMQLDLLQSSFSVLREQQDFAAKLEDIVSQRVQAGLEGALELTRAKLAAARTRLQLADTRAAMDQLRLRLAQLTGRPPNDIQTSTESIPALPGVSQNDDLPGQAAAASPAVRTAEQAAQSKAFRAQGEEKQIYPAIDLVAQYSLFSNFNNYSKFYNNFQKNNITVGVSIRFPFLSATQHWAAAAAAADALKARKEAQNLRDQVSSETLKLQRSVEQLAAARDVSKLEHQLAEADVESTREKIQAGGATLKDEQSAKIVEHEHYTAYLDSGFQLDKAQVQLLRQTGDLEAWALGPKR